MIDSVGNVSEVLPWHGGILPNHGDMNARLVGAAYDTSTISRRCVDGSPTAKAYNVIRLGAASDSFVAMPGLLDETQGFWTSVAADDLQQQNTVFSLYDDLTSAHQSTL